jgi:hypothetical protein
MNNSKAKQIRNLLLIIGSAVVVSCCALFLMLYSSGLSGAYLAKNVLLSPESVKVLNFNNPGPKSSKTKISPQFVFDLIEFSFYDAVHKRVIHTQVDIAYYAELYKIIENDSSLTGNAVLNEAALKFNNIEATLFIKFRSRRGEDVLQGSSDVFKVEFIKDYYRISLRDQNLHQQWAYFKHVNIFEQVLGLFRNDIINP